MVTLADTAALIQEMDLIVTVDTSVVHVAGAIGKEAWLLLPYRYEWRWGLEGESNRWYDSVRVIRQPRHGDWDSVLNDVFIKRFPVRFGQ
jgi:ADP-heptose:LPS heptosyltransferase